MKNKRPGRSPVPSHREETVRQRIIAAIEHNALSAREISGEAGIPERQVSDHLAHIQKTISHQGRSLVVTPAQCNKCGFVFSKREKMKKPGRCPRCRGESIKEPLFEIR